MDRQRPRRWDEESESRRAMAPQRDTSVGSDADSILDLQAQAGNRAVSELLSAREGAEPVPVQRDGGDGTPTATPADTGPSPGVNTMSIPELKLGVPVQSVQNSTRGPGGGGSGGGGEVTVTLSAKDLDPRLWEAAAKGRQFSSITITIGQATITLHGVVISGVNMGTNSASLTLNFSSMEFNPGASGESTEPPPDYDLGK